MPAEAALGKRVLPELVLYKDRLEKIGVSYSAGAFFGIMHIGRAAVG